MDISDPQMGELVPADVRERFFGFGVEDAPPPPSKVHLRPLRADDCGLLFRWCNLPEVAKYMYRDHDIEYPEHRDWFQDERPDRVRWMAEIDGEPFGYAQLYKIDRKNRTFEWGDYIALTEARGKGYGKWIKFLLHAHAFDVLGMNKAVCEVFSDNQAVWLSHLKFGYRIEGYFMQHIRKGGIYRDVVRVGMSAAEWQANRDRIQAGLR